MLLILTESNSAIETISEKNITDAEETIIVQKGQHDENGTDPTSMDGATKEEQIMDSE